MPFGGALLYIAYSLGAIASVLAALWVARRADTSRSDRTAAIVALMLTANWCVAAAAFPPERTIVALSEVARNLAWLFAIFRLYANDGRDESVRIVRPAFVSMALVECFQLLLLVLMRSDNLSEAARQLVFETSSIFHMLVAVGVIVLLHNLYVGASTSSRMILRWSVAALAGLWAFDLNYYTVAYFSGRLPAELSVLRGVATAVIVIPFAIGFSANAGGLQFSPSRAATFRFLSLLVVGLYLMLMAGLARLLNLQTGDMARLAQVGLVIAAAALALVWLPSNHLRGWLRVTAVKHLFKHRYDYRSEWIRFTNTIGRSGADETSLQERVVKALADITDSPSGLLLLTSEEGGLELTARWNWRDADVPARAVSPELAAILEKEGLIVDFDEVRCGRNHRGELDLIPMWLKADPQSWAMVPLLHFDRLIGAVVLQRPAIQRKLDWEDFDLLGVVGRQLASYLAEEAGQAALLEAGRFDEFNRRMAFVMHDIKNLSSQMSLLLRNAEKHADNPEFRKDMLITLRNSADKLNLLLARLGRYGGQGSERREAFDLAAVARQVVLRFTHLNSVTLTHSEPVWVSGDPEGAEQALVHLVQNAIDASPEGGTVMLDVSSDGMMGRIQVIDSGSGMDAQFLRSGLFKPFVSSKPGGFGIGAYEAREIIRAMNGRLEVESREGLGTRFTISLPLQAIERMIAQASAPSHTHIEAA